MKSRRFFRWVSLAGAFLLLTSCIDSKNPLSSPQKAEVDDQLMGVWRTTSDAGDVEYCHIGRAGDELPPGITRAVSVTHTNDGTLEEPGDLLVFSTILSENRYLNVLAIDEKNRDQVEENGYKPKLIEGYWFVKYRIKGDSLDVWTMNSDAKRKAIQSGKIKGTVKENTSMLTDTPENLASLLSSEEGAKLFAEGQTIHDERVK